AGSRPMTPDGLPVIGRLDSVANAYVNSGHSMLGLTLAPGSARLLAELMTDGSPSLPAEQLGTVAPPRVWQGTSTGLHPAGSCLGRAEPRPDGPGHRQPARLSRPPPRAPSSPARTGRFDRTARPHHPTLRDNRPRQGRQMTTEQFSGVLAAVVTPFTADGSAVDVEGVRRQADHIISGGVNGLVPGGSTGEFTALTVEERKASNRAYIEAAAGRAPSSQAPEP